MPLTLRNGREVLDEVFINDPEIVYDSVTKTDNYTVLQTDSGKTLVMNSSSNKAFTITAGLTVGSRFTLTEVNTGRLTIQMSGSETVDDSNAGGTIYSDEDTISSMTIEKVSSTHYQIMGANGSWTTT